jgi:hypothetical protein
MNGEWRRGWKVKRRKRRWEFGELHLTDGEGEVEEKGLKGSRNGLSPGRCRKKT